MQINGRKHHNVGFGFPLNHYEGITVAIYIEEALKTLSTIFQGFSIDLQELYNKFCYKESPFIMRAKDSIEHIFLNFIMYLMRYVQIILKSKF